MHDSLSPASPNQASSARPTSRELEAQFYREIGLSAVAAALSLRLESGQIRRDRPIAVAATAPRAG